MSVSAQFALYPLRASHISPTLETALDAARASGVDIEMGRMSSTMEGSIDQVFEALRAAFEITSASGDTVLVVTVSNACPVLRAG